MYESSEEFLSSDEHEGSSSRYEKSDSDQEKFEKVFKRECEYENRSDSGN